MTLSWLFSRFGSNKTAEQWYASVLILKTLIHCLSFPPQLRRCDQGLPKGHDSYNPHSFCSGSLLARPAGGVHRSSGLPLEAAGRLNDYVCRL